MPRFITKGRGKGRKVIPLEDKAEVPVRARAMRPKVRDDKVRMTIVALDSIVTLRSITMNDIIRYSALSGQKLIDIPGSELVRNVHVSEDNRVYFILSYIQDGARIYSIREFDPEKGFMNPTGFWSYGNKDDAISKMMTL